MPRSCINYSMQIRSDNSRLAPSIGRLRNKINQLKRLIWTPGCDNSFTVKNTEISQHLTEIRTILDTMQSNVRACNDLRISQI